MNEAIEAPAGQVPAEKPKKLTRRQKRWADLHLTGLSGAECLRRMGDEGTAQQLADRAYRIKILRHVKAYIDERLKDEEDAFQINKASVMRRLYLAASLEVSVADLVDEGGTPIPLKQLPAEIAALIVRMEVEDMFEGLGDARVKTGVRYKYWLQDGKGSAEVLARCRGWFKDKLDVNTNAPPPVITIMAYEDDDDAERNARAAVSRQSTPA